MKFAMKFLYVVMGLSLMACNEVYIIIEGIPKNTPPNEPIYIVGNFNNWEVNDERYRLEDLADGRKRVKLPKMMGMVEFKFTRGNWLNVETDSCGKDIENRRIHLDKSGEIVVDIMNWKDRSAVLCDFTEVVVNCENAGVEPFDEVFLSGNHNDWKAFDPMYRLKRINAHTFVGKLPKINHDLEFKVLRGDWSTVEVLRDGRPRENRVLNESSPDSIYLEVDEWNDKVAEAHPELVILVNKMPVIPETDTLFLASNINNWDPGSPKFKFERNTQGKHFIRLPRKTERLFFKITRGDWKMVEVKPDGTDIDNREWLFSKRDTLMVEIEAFKDLFWSQTP